jgi:hypothetical protein
VRREQEQQKQADRPDCKSHRGWILKCRRKML